MKSFAPIVCAHCGGAFTPSHPRQPYCSTRCNLFAHVSVAGPDECWLWAAYINPTGYGQITTGGKPQLAHRVAWVVENGEIPEGLNVLHKCDVRACVNPSHLFLGSHADNSADMVSKGRTRPVNGSRVWSSKLSDSDVMAILGAKDASTIDLATRFGVAKATIINIRAGRRWKHLQGDHL